MRLSDIFSDREFFRSVCKIAIPISLGQLLSSTLSLIDALMVGTLGENELAAIGMAGQYVTFNLSLCAGNIIGSMMFYAQYWGVKDTKGIRKVSSIAFLPCFTISLILCLFALIRPISAMQIYTNDSVINAIGARYLRIISVGLLISIFVSWSGGLLNSTENVKLPMFASISSLVTNTLGNWVLIYGKLGMPALGVEGAAIATLLSHIVNASIILIVSCKQKNVLIDAIKHIFCVDFSFIKTFYRKAIPLIINEAFYGVAVLLINMTLGRQGADNLSALAIFRSIEGFVLAFYQGLAGSARVIVGKSIGAGEIKKGIKNARKLSVLCPILSISTCTFIFLLRRPITALYAISDDIKHTAFTMLFIYIFAATLRTTNYLLVNIYRAGGESKLGMYLEVGGIWIFGVPLVALTGLVWNAPFAVVFMMLYAEDAAKICIEFYYFFKNKWIKPVTPEGQEGLRVYLESFSTTKIDSTN